MLQGIFVKYLFSCLTDMSFFVLTLVVVNAACDGVAHTLQICSGIIFLFSVGRRESSAW